MLSHSFQLKQKFLRKLFDGSLDTAAFFTKLRNNGKTETDVQSYAKLFAELRKLVDSKQVEHCTALLLESAAALLPVSAAFPIVDRRWHCSTAAATVYRRTVHKIL